jgi:hypothetical protein
MLLNGDAVVEAILRAIGQAAFSPQSGIHFSHPIHAMVSRFLMPLARR